MVQYVGEECLKKPREKSIYRFICDFIKNNHYSPSIIDISKATGVSQGCVPEYLNKLSIKGLITYEKHASRSIVLSKYEYRLIAI